jgi:hypothetical protein
VKKKYLIPNYSPSITLAIIEEKYGSVREGFDDKPQ